MPSVRFTDTYTLTGSDRAGAGTVTGNESGWAGEWKTGAERGELDLGGGRRFGRL